MQLSMQGITIINQLKETIMKLKNEEGVKQCILPSIDILKTSISRSSKEKLKNSIIDLGIASDGYDQVLEEYKKLQIVCFYACIDAIIKYLQVLIDNKNVTDMYFNKLLDFVEFEQLSTITPDLSPGALDNFNAAIRCRLIYVLMDLIYTTLGQFHGGFNVIAANTYDQSLLKKIDRITEESVQNQDKRPHLLVLFTSELLIREASILATGEFIRGDHLQDIFLVYKIAAYGAHDMRQHDHSISYYNLAVRTLTQLSRAAGMMQSQQNPNQLSVSIQPINQETSVGHHGIVRRSVFGVSIVYQDSQSLALNINSSPGFNHVYQIEPQYRLYPELKMAYLAHIKLLTEQLSGQPKHHHKKRRQEKLAALEYIVNADNRNELSPTVVEEAKAGKYLLYLARGESTTQKLIEFAESNIKAKMWQQSSREKNSIGHLGYCILEQELVEKILNKYLGFSQGNVFDVNQHLKDLLKPKVERGSLEGTLLWRYDKKMALEIILVAHHQQLLHPAVIKSIEENYPMLYARSFWMFRDSEVEVLIRSVKEHLVTQLWHDAANDVCYPSRQIVGVN